MSVIPSAVWFIVALVIFMLFIITAVIPLARYIKKRAERNKDKESQGNGGHQTH